MTALSVEYRAVRRFLSNVAEDTHASGAIYETGRFENEGAAWDVLIGTTGRGNVKSAHETERAVAHFNPEVAIFVGVAGGRKDVAKGDVVAADKVYGYESGKDVAGRFKPRPEVCESSYAILHRAQAEARQGVRAEGLPDEDEREPQALVGAIASGEKVVGSSKSAVAELLGDNYGDALAVEMEGYGFLRALKSHVNVQGLLVRGVSDLIDDKDEQADLRWQPLAAGNASAFAFRVLSRFAPPVSGTIRAPLPNTTSGSSAAASPARGVAPDPFLRTHIVPASAGHDRVPRCGWVIELVPRAAVDTTRTELHAALIKATVVQDMRDYGRQARWPRLLRLEEAVQETLDDGRHLWRHAYPTMARNEVGEEFLALSPRGDLMFQRETLWDVEKLAIDIGQLAFDLVVLGVLGSNFLAHTGSASGFDLTVRVRTSQAIPGTVAHFSHGIVAEQPHRTAHLRKTSVSGTTHFAAGALQEREALTDTFKRAIDRVANEFELEPGHFVSSSPPFLSVARESVAALLEPFS